MTDPLHDTELTGTISTPRHTAVRWRAGHECGDLFAEGDEFDGLTLTIEVSGAADALAMIAAIRRPDLKLMREPHAVMRKCGWHLALTADDDAVGDGCLALAAADVLRRFAEFLGARHIPGVGNMATATITAQDAAQVPEIAALVDASTALRDSMRQFAGTGRMLGSVDDRYRAVDAALHAIEGGDE